MPKNQKPGELERKLEVLIEQSEQVSYGDGLKAFTHFVLGYKFHKKRRLNDAVKEYRKALTYDFEYADIHAMLGIALYRQGKEKEAIDELKIALRLDNGNINAHSALKKFGISLEEDD